MKRFLSFLLFVSACFAFASAKHHVPFLTSKSKPALTTLAPTTKSSLAIRGGSLDPKFFTDAMTIASLGHGFLSMEAPEVSMDMYGADEDQKADLYSKYTTQISGTAILSIGVLALCMFTLDVDLIKAIGWSSVVWIVHLGRTLLNKIPEKMGSSNSITETVYLALVIAQTHAAFTGAPYAKTLLKAAFGLGFVSSIFVILSPKKSVEFYGLEKDMTNEQLWCNRNQGYSCLAMSTFILSLLKGVEAEKALGYTSLAFIVHMIHGYLGTGQRDNYPFVSVLVWMIFHSANFLTLGLKE